MIKEFTVLAINKLYNQVAHFNMSKSGVKQLNIILENMNKLSYVQRKDYLLSEVKSYHIFAHETEKMVEAIAELYEECASYEEETPCEAIDLSDDEVETEVLDEVKLPSTNNKFYYLILNCGVTACYQKDKTYIFTGVNKIVSTKLLRELSGFDNVVYKKDYVPSKEDKVIFNEK